MNNWIFDGYFAHFEGIWQAKVGKKVNDDGDFDDGEEYQWRWQVISMMMKRKTDDYVEEEVKQMEN